MSKKLQFKHLSTGNEELKQSLNSLILNKDQDISSFNPLTQNKKKGKKPVARPSKIQIDTTSKPDTDVDNGESQVKTKPVEKSPIKLPKENEPIQAKKEAPIQKQVKNKKTENKPATTKTPVKTVQPLNVDDFKPHSSLFSSTQLDNLRKEVFKRKAAGDHKYSIKDAVYEAFSLYLSRRETLQDFPDDFITYTASMSMSQFEQVKNFVYQVKAEGEFKYAMKYAIYEAIEMWLSRQ